MQSAHTSVHTFKITKSAYKSCVLHSYVGLTSVLIGSMHHSLHIPQIRINPMKTACRCAYNKIKFKFTNAHTRNPLII